MHFQPFRFGSIVIDGRTYEHDVVIDRGEIRKRKKGPSKQFRTVFGHTPLSIEEDIPGTATDWSSAPGPGRCRSWTR